MKFSLKGDLRANMPGFISTTFPNKVAHSACRLQNRLMLLRSITLRRKTAAISAGIPAYNPNPAGLRFRRRSVMVAL